MSSPSKPAALRRNDIQITDVTAIVSGSEPTTILRNCGFFKGHRTITTDNNVCVLHAEIMTPNLEAVIHATTVKFHTDSSCAQELVDTLTHVNKHLNAVTQTVVVPTILGVGSCPTSKLEAIGLDIDDDVERSSLSTDDLFHGVVHTYIQGKTFAQLLLDSHPDSPLPLPATHAIGVIDWEHTTYESELLTLKKTELAFPVSAFRKCKTRDWSIFDLRTATRRGYGDDSRFDPRAYVWTRILYDILSHFTMRKHSDSAVDTLVEKILNVPSASSVKAFFLPLTSPAIASDHAIHLAIDELEAACNETVTPEITSDDDISGCEDFDVDAPSVKRRRVTFEHTLPLRRLLCAVLRHVAAFATACKASKLYHFDFKAANIIIKK